MPATSESELGFAAEFLRAPDLFPARPAGEPWGSGRVRIDAIGGPYQFLGVDAAQGEFLRRHFAPLLLADEAGERDVPLRIFRIDPAELLEVAGPDWVFRLDLDPSPEALRWAGRRLLGRLDWRPELAASAWMPPGDEAERLGSFENVLRIAAAYRSIETGGVLLHSAGVVADGRAWLFYGRSGAGKSTLSRLSAEAGHLVLSDELNAVVATPEGPRLERMPFSGDFGRDVGRRQSWPLAGIFALRQGSAPARSPLSRGAAVAGLLACAPFVNADPHRSEALLAALDRLTSARPPETLTFRRDASFWDIVLAAS